MHLPEWVQHLCGLKLIRDLKEAEKVHDSGARRLEETQRRMVYLASLAPEERVDYVLKRLSDTAPQHDSR